MSRVAKHPWLVCVKPRVVLFGYATEAEMRKPQPKLERCRMLVYWSNRGLFDAAVSGPSPGSRVSPAVPWHRPSEVEGYSLCTPEAAARFEAEPWG